MAYATKKSNGFKSSKSSKSSPLFESEAEALTHHPGRYGPFLATVFSVLTLGQPTVFRFVSLLTQPMAAHPECEFALGFLAGETALL